VTHVWVDIEQAQDGCDLVFSQDGVEPGATEGFWRDMFETLQDAFYLLDCSELDAALEWGRRMPAYDVAGEPLIETHDETSSAAGPHEELYVVLSGRATFTVAGHELDAPASSLLLVEAAPNAARPDDCAGGRRQAGVSGACGVTRQARASGFATAPTGASSATISPAPSARPSPTACSTYAV